MLPTPITGDFARDYNFVFKLYENPNNPLSSIQSMIKSSTGLPSSLSEPLAAVFDSTVIEYVSTLAHKVSVDADSVDMGAGLELLGVKWMEPKSRPAKTVTVTFFDDDDRSVYLFHAAWLACIQDGAGFRCFDDLALSMMVSGARRTASGDVPLAPCVYQKVFPVSVSGMSGLSKEGSNLVEVEVRYQRLPLITGTDEVEKYATTTGESSSVSSYLSLSSVAG